MNKNKNNTEIESFPRISPAEFKFIRQNVGLSQEFVASHYNRCSRSTIYYWEHQKRMKPYQIMVLKNLVSDEMWDECRRLYKEENGL